MSDIQRYDAWPQECPFEDKNGEFVTYEDHIKIVKELEAKLAMAVGALKSWLELASYCTIEEGVCCCGDDMKSHADPMGCGHLPVDHGAYIAHHIKKSTRAILAELKGDKE
jgi:hypothetical protein